MKKLTIIGASGHGKVIADVARLNGYREIVFLDDNESITECAGYPVKGKSNDASNGEIFVAVGNSAIREKLMNLYKKERQPILIHPSAVIADGVKIGEGTVVMAGVVVNAGTQIGNGCIINTSSSVDHDCVIDDYVHISVGSHLAGTVSIGKRTWIGAGATVSNNVNICEDCIVGAGAVVIKDIDIPGTYIGIPAKRIKKEKK